MVISMMKINSGMEKSVKVSVVAMEDLHHGSVWNWLIIPLKILRYAYVEIRIQMMKITPSHC